LLVLPEAAEARRVARHFLKGFPNLQPDGTKLRLLCHQQQLEFYQGVNAAIETYSDRDLTWWHLPHREFIRRLFTEPVEAAVDLNPTFHPVAASLVQASGAPLRIGFQSEFAERFFNVVLVHRGSDLLEKAYLNVRQLLGI
jgi:hypothetical protein